MNFSTQQRTVQDLVNWYKNRHLNLEPGFQRKSVWSDRDRRKLMHALTNTPAYKMIENHLGAALVKQHRPIAVQIPGNP